MAKREQSPGEDHTFCRLTSVVLLLVLVVLSLAALANALVKPLGRDEHMYCTAGVLLAQGKLIYRDFCYVAQLPYHPLCLSLLYRALQTTHYLLVARLFSAVCDIGTMLGIVWVFRCAFRPYTASGTLLGLAGVVLYAFNPVVDYANGYAWNNDAVVFCVVLAFCLYIRIDPLHKSKYWLATAIGAVLAFATWTRMTSSAYLVAFLLMLLLMPAVNVKQRIKIGLAYLLAVVVVSLWPISIIIRAPQAFVIDVFRIHMLNSEWLGEIGMVFPKSQLLMALLMQPGYLVLLVIAAFLCSVLAVHRRWWWDARGRKTVVAATLATIACLIALILPTIWQQYLAPPVPLMVIAFAYPLAFLRHGSDGKGLRCSFGIAVVLMGLATLVAVCYSPGTIGRIAALGNTDLWTSTQVKRASQDIVSKGTESEPILTTAPLFALEGGGRIYPEFAAGPFPYRIGTMLSDQQRRITRTVGPGGIEKLVAESPPSTVLVGVESGRLVFLEEPLREVVGADWTRTSYGNGLVAFHRP